MTTFGNDPIEDRPVFGMEYELRTQVQVTTVDKIVRGSVYRCYGKDISLLVKLQDRPEVKEAWLFTNYELLKIRRL